MLLVEGQQDTILPSSPPQPVKCKYPESHVACAELGSQSCVLGGGGQCSGRQLSIKEEKEVARDTEKQNMSTHTPGLDCPEPWTEDVRSGEDRPVSEDPSPPEPLKTLRSKSTERVGYQGLSLSRAFGSFGANRPCKYLHYINRDRYKGQTVF